MLSPKKKEKNFFKDTGQLDYLKGRKNMSNLLDFQQKSSFFFEKSESISVFYTFNTKILNFLIKPYLSSISWTLLFMKIIQKNEQIYIPQFEMVNL